MSRLPAFQLLTLRLTNVLFQRRLPLSEKTWTFQSYNKPRQRRIRKTILFSASRQASNKSSSIILPNPIILQDVSKTVHLIGTAHVSEKSANEVRKLIQRVQPQQVVVELDWERAERLRKAPSEENNFLDFFKIFSQRNIPISANIFEFSVRTMYGLLRKAGFVPGLEFLTAVEEAEKIQAQVVYGDRHFKETMKRIGKELEGQRFSFFRQFLNVDAPELDKIFQNSDNLRESIDKLLDRQNVRILVQFMRKTVPPFAKVLLDERDLYLLRALKMQQGPQVVGVAHLEGIESQWHLDLSKIEAMIQEIEGKQ
eukprot:jgi/Galph1/34/GphlegSOOS_G4838.1